MTTGPDCLTRRTFDDEVQFKLALETCFEKPGEIFEHEKAHADAMRNLGYTPQFTIDLGDNSIITHPKEEIKDSRHRVIIALAPKDPSPHDMMIAEEYARG